jgi:hypothetical protein
MVWNERTRSCRTAIIPSPRSMPESKKIEYTKKEQNTKRELCIISLDRYLNPSRTAACPVDIIEKQEERGAN